VTQVRQSALMRAMTIPPNLPRMPWGRPNARLKMDCYDTHPCSLSARALEQAPTFFVSCAPGRALDLDPIALRAAFGLGCVKT
jgi:hypothetical protein